MDTKSLQFHHHSHKLAWLIAVICAFAAGLIFAFVVWTRSPRIVRGVYIEGIYVSGLSREEALNRLEKDLPDPDPVTVTISYEDKSWATSAAELGLHRNYDAVLAQAMELGRRSTLVTQQSVERAQLLASPANLEIPLNLNRELLKKFVSSIADEVNLQGEQPFAELTNNGFKINAGSLGQRLVEAELIDDIMKNPTSNQPFSAPVEITVVPLSADAQIVAQQRLERLRPVALLLQTGEGESQIQLRADIFFPWLILPEGWQPEKIEQYIDTLAEKINRDPVDAEFELGEKDNRLKKFQPQLDGREILRDQMHLELVDTLNRIGRGAEEDTEIIINIPVRQIEAKIKLEDLNSLGIKEKIGSGNSTYYHSIPNRIFNVGLTSERLHAYLIKPGEEFSFNRAVGEVSRRTGFKPAYVISGGRTVLGDGGGVCQVSTTTFRAALDAGLPITAWKAHSYRVGYYEQNSQPGFDATVYSPSVDLRFRNDTDHAIVVATRADSENLHLIVELWGSSDGRASSISNYKLTQTGSLPPAYIPDPTLPSGTVRQVDWAAPGAVASFAYKVVDKNGETLHEREFVSRFQAWRSVFMVGTQ